ncbi:chorismate mutase [Chondromyces crocatus]|uniref:chorismate mutase n=1 Tax=Chondromyces crocatus TaxID=52 RepID=A0A0K1EPX5_CHOCO|nr:chorismate mutase [Chondromyces crocatus]AKT42869.1 uncharacterized protein CMC5_070970 [Chondromyces crocatus]
MHEPSTSPADLAMSRAALDALDEALLDLVARRRAIVEAIFGLKRRHGLPLIDPEREHALLVARRALAEQRGVPCDLAERLFLVILEGSHAQAREPEATPSSGS